jgi:hypothetical protein
MPETQPPAAPKPKRRKPRPFTWDRSKVGPKRYACGKIKKIGPGRYDMTTGTYADDAPRPPARVVLTTDTDIPLNATVKTTVRWRKS